MITISAADVHALLTWPALIDALDRAFRDGVIQPVRHHHTIERPTGAASTLLLMPAWSDFSQLEDPSKGYIGVKIVTVSPDNGAIGKPAVMGIYLLIDGITGEPKALIDGQTLTNWRTAAASALAARYLARQDASKLTVMGAGAVAAALVRAHSAVRPINEIKMWARNRQRAEETIKTLRADGFNIDFVADPAEAIAFGDIVAAATLSTEPLILHRHVKPGTHIDLLGAFTPTMRESDDDLVKAARVFVDTRGGALKEGGDIVQPLAAGIINEDHVCGDLYDLTRGTVRACETADEITLFKSVGAALEDLTAGILVYEKSMEKAQDKS
ncbi:ornithine cyclodeaminase family protein [Paraburkholderia aspalathi]|nr:ornithine cyclodeaminase family protein [Paraburkholderia aspalathi]